MTQQEQIYTIASELATSKRAVDIKRAMDLFESIPEYEDATSCVQACRERLEQLAQSNICESEQESFDKLKLATYIIVSLLLCCIFVGLFVVIFPRETEMSNVTDIPTPQPTATSLIPFFSSKDIDVGMVVQFGTYEQDNVLENGAEPIEWLVLEVRNHKALLISRYGLDCRRYHEMKNITWETCELRQWLNTTFYETAFMSSQQYNILDTQPNYDAAPDKIFLLNCEDASFFLRNDESRMTLPTAYAVARGADAVNQYTYWWLRSPGESGYDYAACVRSTGIVDTDGVSVCASYVAVRPAMWVTLAE